MMVKDDEDNEAGRLNERLEVPLRRDVRDGGDARSSASRRRLRSIL